MVELDGAEFFRFIAFLFIAVSEITLLMYVTHTATKNKIGKIK